MPHFEGGETTVRMVHYPEARATDARDNIFGTAAYQITPAGAKTPVHTGQVENFTGYSATALIVGTQSSTRDANQRIIRRSIEGSTASDMAHMAQQAALDFAAQAEARAEAEAVVDADPE